MGQGCVRSTQVTTVEPWSVVNGSIQNHNGAIASDSRAANKPPCNKVIVARLRKDKATSEELGARLEVLEVPVRLGSKVPVSAIQKALASRWNVPPEMQLLSFYDDRLRVGQEALAPDLRPVHVTQMEPEVRDARGVKIRERLIGEYGLPSEGIWVHMTDYSSLRPPGNHQATCSIPEVDQRGVTLAQMMRVWRFVEEHTGPMGELVFWADRRRGNVVMGYDMNMYSLTEWVIKPATYEYHCSFTEILAANAEDQVPSLFCSHWFGIPQSLLVNCLKEHCRIRSLPDSTAYWIYACAESQHQPRNAQGISSSSSVKAMQRCQGAVLVVDDMGVTLMRSWCCFETYMMVRSDPSREGFTFDVATAWRSFQGEATSVVLTEGLTEEEQLLEETGSGIGWNAKAKRESDFPSHLISRALVLDVSKCQAAEEPVQRAILNEYVGQMATSQPPAQHKGYDLANSKIKAWFAVTGWRHSLEADQMMQSATGMTTAILSHAVRADVDRRSLSLGFVQCGKSFNNSKLFEVATGLPPHLENLQLLLGGCMINQEGISAFLHKLPTTLSSFSLSLSSLPLEDGDVAAISALLPQQIVALQLGLDCSSVLDLHSFHLPPILETLELNISNNPGLGDEAFSSLAKAVPRSLLHVSVLSRRTGLGDRGVAEFVAALPEKTQELVLKLDGTRVSEFAGLQLPPKLVGLEIGISKIRTFGDAGLLELAKTLPRSLKHFGLHAANTCISDAGLENLSKAIPESLEELVLVLAGTKVTQAGLRTLASSMPGSLEALDIDLSNGLVASESRVSTSKRRTGSSASLEERIEEDVATLKRFACRVATAEEVREWCDMMLQTVSLADS